MRKKSQERVVGAMYGYVGKLLFVDLTNRTFEVRDLDEKAARDYVGGLSLGAKILYDEMPAKTPVFAPESMIGFVSSPANGTGPFMGGRFTVVSKSPVTGGFNDASAGGNFGPLMKRAGYDAIFFKGISEKPVYVFIDDGKVEFRDATHLWGKTTMALERAIKEELGDPKVAIASIGPGGENLSNMAGIMHDEHRAAARGGSGAVMGSKKLKAVVVRGNHRVQPYDREAVLALNKEVAEWQKGPVAPVFELFTNHGTGGTYESGILNGDTSVKNWLGTAADLTEEQRKKPTSQEQDKLFKVRKYACHACPVGCGAIYSVKDGKWPIEETGRPEYETDGMFGSMLLNDDVYAINQCNFLCNEYGLDTISVGATIAWLMECYNNGVFTKEEIDGIDLTWGNADAIVAMTEKICKGEGIGKILQAGSVAAAKHFNKGFEALVHASGIEIPQHDPRWSPGLARTYQYDPTPGRHVKGGLSIHYGNQPPEVRYDYTNTGERDVNGVVYSEALYATGFCTMSDFGLPPEIHIKFLTAVTGFEYTPEEARNLGIRSYTIRHAFNLREGFRRKDFTISDRIIGIPPLKEGPTAGVTVDAKMIADNFFRELGWNLDDAVPTKESLERVGGLENVIKDLYPNG